MSYLRKKLQAIMACADFKGYLREVTGAPPLTLTDCMGSDLVSLSVTGNAVQDGTPSPDAPVEVQGVGERTGNLFDVEAFVAHLENNAITGGTHEIVELDGEMVLKYDGYGLYDSNGQTGDFFAVSCDANTQYTFSCTFKGSGAAWLPDTKGILAFRFEYNDGTYGACIIRNTANWTKISFTTAADKTLSAIYAYRYNATYAYIKDISLLKGSYTTDTIPPYEPYGYKVPVKVGGINLFDVSQLTDTSSITRDGDKLILNGYACVSQLSPEKFLKMTGLQPGDTITTTNDTSVSKGVANSVTGHIEFTGRSGGATYMLSNSSAPYTSVIPDDFDSEHYNNAIFYGAVTPDENGDRIAEMSNIMIVKGTYAADTMPPFEPYHEPQTVSVYTDKPLYAVGDVGDTIIVDFDTKTATRIDRIKINELKSTDTWNDTWFPSIVKSLPSASYALTAGNIMSNYFSINADTTEPAAAITNTAGSAIGIQRANLIDGVTDLDTFKSWLSDKSVYAYYSLATPTTTDISALQDWDAMPSTWRGTVVISAGTVIQPSSMTARYYTTKKED